MRMAFVSSFGLGNGMTSCRNNVRTRCEFSLFHHQKNVGGQFRQVPSTRVRMCESAETEKPQESVTESSPKSKRVAPTVPQGFTPPEPRTFFVRPDQFLNVITGSVGSAMRLYSGALVSGYSLGIADGKITESSSSLPMKRPEQPLEVYEFEACPFCRKVREALTILDLDVYIYPTPKNGVRFRPLVENLGGKQQFPYLVDPNTGFADYESSKIVEYLFNTYGDGNVPLGLRLGAVTTLSSGLATLPRSGRGASRAGSKVVFPEFPLELWSYEPSPFCKIPREALCELELPYLLHNTARGSVKRAELKERVGRFQVPYLEDPNTGVKMFESADIVKYLYDTYGENAPGATAELPEEFSMIAPKLPTEN
uniref:GST N-terminal domain-containing protein n=1 Tax=Timspurckia oligopyrenoides TaxID=708627 RepID=A0A7S0ZAQ1_9RHOD|mmetsp:Transcript_10454/g.18838  ORF Transcript_10454/g.18838 Transcript_10454/m.18838 type:complete len:368 (+) Transcript_10454:107-1210(+)